MDSIRDGFFLISITTLCGVGTGITLWSGFDVANQPRTRQVFSNLSWLILSLTGYLILLAMAHDWMGYPFNIFP